jgi:hypothetical protein
VDDDVVKDHQDIDVKEVVGESSLCVVEVLLHAYDHVDQVED